MTDAFRELEKKLNRLQLVLVLFVGVATGVGAMLWFRPQPAPPVPPPPAATASADAPTPVETVEETPDPVPATAPLEAEPEPEPKPEPASEEEDNLLPPEIRVEVEKILKGRKPKDIFRDKDFKSTGKVLGLQIHTGGSDVKYGPDTKLTVDGKEVTVKFIVTLNSHQGWAVEPESPPFSTYLFRYVEDGWEKPELLELIPSTAGFGKGYMQSAYEFTTQEWVYLLVEEVTE